MRTRTGSCYGLHHRFPRIQALAVLCPGLSGGREVQLTIQVSIAGAKDFIGSVQRILPSLLPRVELLDGLQEQTEAVIGQPLPAWTAAPRPHRKAHVS